MFKVGDIVYFKYDNNKLISIIIKIDKNFFKLRIWYHTDIDEYRHVYAYCSFNDLEEI